MEKTKKFINSAKEFLLYLKKAGLGIFLRRSLDGIAAINAWLATQGFGQIDPEQAQQAVGIFGNATADILISVVLVGLSRWLSYNKDVKKKVGITPNPPSNPDLSKEVVDPVESSVEDTPRNST